MNIQASGAPIRGWIAVSAVGLQGKGLRTRNVFSQTPVCKRKTNKAYNTNRDRTQRSMCTEDQQPPTICDGFGNVIETTRTDNIYMGIWL